MAEMKSVGRAIRKKDAMQLLLGKPVYTDDITPRDCLCVGVLRSPHAHALITEIDTAAACRLPGLHKIIQCRLKATMQHIIPPAVRFCSPPDRSTA